MTVIGFTADGDVIANDPASPDDTAVRRVYKRARVREHLAPDQALQRVRQASSSGTGGVCYLYFPAQPTAAPARRPRGGGRPPC